MRHRCKVHHLGKPADQRKALLRSLATSLFIENEIVISLGRAKALKEYADKIITLAKREGDVHAIRQAKALIFDQETGETLTGDGGKEMPETVLRRLFRNIGPRFKARNGGYTRVVKMPPRRGDGAPMALVQLVD